MSSLLLSSATLEARSMEELISSLPQEVKDMILEIMGIEDPYALIGISRRLHERNIPRLYASAMLLSSEGSKRFIECSDRAAWVHLNSLRLFGPNENQDDWESPLDGMYGRESYRLQRFDTLYLDKEIAQIILHYMKPNRLHHHDQRQHNHQSPMHRGTSTPSSALSLKQVSFSTNQMLAWLKGHSIPSKTHQYSVNFWPPCLRGYYYGHVPATVYHYESWRSDSHIWPRWHTGFKPSGLMVDLHYVCILLNYSTEESVEFDRKLGSLMDRLDDFLINWRNSTVNVYFVDRNGNHQHMRLRRAPVWRAAIPQRAAIPHHRLNFPYPENIDPEIKEMVRLIMEDEAESYYQPYHDIALDFLFEYRSGTADPDSAVV